MEDDILITKIADSVQAALKGSQMTLDHALALIAKVKEKAKKQNLSVVIAVTDSAGHPIAVECMDQSYYGSYDVALHKAYTSILFRMTTEELGKLSQPGKELYGVQYTNEGKIVIFGGGVPLIWNHIIVGALGVSGGTLSQDISLANYGQSMLREVIDCR